MIRSIADLRAGLWGYFGTLFGGGMAVLLSGVPLYGLVIGGVFALLINPFETEDW